MSEVAIRPKPCKGCGETFTPPTFRQRFCNSCRNECSVEGCHSAVKAHRLCGMHLWRQTTKGDAGPPGTINKRQSGTCSVAGCDKPKKSKGFCSTHYWRFKTHGTPGSAEILVKSAPPECIVDGCSGKPIGNGYCRMHYERIRNTGEVGSALPTRKSAGEGHLSKTGYRVVTIDGRSVLEHRYVLEQQLGRPLLPHESAHHRNGQRADNRPSNLELWSKAQPAGQRVPDKLAFAVEMIALYREFLTDEQAAAVKAAVG